MRMFWMIAGALACVAAPSARAVGIDHELVMRDGTAKDKATLRQLRDATVTDLVAERFSIALEDLNGDGNKEIILQAADSGFCGSSGCLLLVLEKKGARVRTLMSTYDPASAVTRESINGYRALAVPDGKGGIQLGTDKARRGQPLVFPMKP